jgi:Txe/YoeB family toxin of Txe-Axe toxin-antitoxin module
LYKLFRGLFRGSDEIERKLSHIKAKSEYYTRQVDEIDRMQKNMAQHIKIDGGYCKVTGKGQKKLKQLSARLPRVQFKSYEEFEKELDEVYNRLKKRYNKFIDMYNYMIENGFERSPRVVQAALSLSTRPESISRIFKRMMYIDEHLYKKGYVDSCRLSTSVELTLQEGDTRELTRDLEKIHKIMLKDGHSDTCDTLLEAANILKIPGKTLKEKYDRFEKMRKALTNIWSRRSRITGYLAYNLAKNEGDVEQIAKDFRGLKKKLIEGGMLDCKASSIAAMLLFNAHGSPSEKAERFNKTFDTMNKYRWERYTSHYPAAAVISLMPGTIEENVQLLDEMYHKIIEKGFSVDLTNRAAQILTGGSETWKYLLDPDFEKLLDQNLITQPDMG